LDNSDQDVIEVVSITRQLQSLINGLADAIAARVDRTRDNGQRLMDVGDAAKYLGMSTHALRHKAGSEIPCVRIDGKLRFDKRDLDNCVDRAKRQGV